MTIKYPKVDITDHNSMTPSIQAYSFRDLL